MGSAYDVAGGVFGKSVEKAMGSPSPLGMLLILATKYYSLRSIVIESFCHFGTLYSNRVLSFFIRSKHIFHTYFTLSYFSLSSSLYFFHFPLYSTFA